MPGRGVEPLADERRLYTVQSGQRIFINRYPLIGDGLVHSIATHGAGESFFLPLDDGAWVTLGHAEAGIGLDDEFFYFFNLNRQAFPLDTYDPVKLDFLDAEVDAASRPHTLDGRRDDPGGVEDEGY